MKFRSSAVANATVRLLGQLCDAFQNEVPLVSCCKCYSEVIRAIMWRFSKWSSARQLLQMLSSQRSCFFSVFDVKVTSRLEWTINRSMTLCLEWVPAMIHCYWRSLRTEELTRCFRILYSWVRASWIKFNNCPTTCDCIQFDIFL